MNLNKEVYLYQQLGSGPESKVECQLCQRQCRIDNGNKGACGVRKNSKGKLYSLNYEKAVATAVDPIEKKPLFHFKPGSSVFSLAAGGCNFNCDFCQNWQISQVKGEEIPGKDLSVEKVVEQARRKAEGIAYTYTEPTVFFEYAYDTAKRAKDAGLYNVFVSNGYMTPEAIDKIAPYLDAINVDLKAMNNKFYRQLCGVSSYKPILNSIERLLDQGVHVEVTNLLIPGYNTSSSDIRRLCNWLSDLKVDIPLHFSRFMPCYQLKNVERTSWGEMEKAVDIAETAGLNYIYVGNLRHKRNNTFCPNCEAKLIDRKGYRVKINLEQAACPQCGHELPLIL